MKIIGIIIAAVVIVGGFGYWYWTSTPFFAFQEAGVAVAQHDVGKFRQAVDLDALVSSAFEDLLYRPVANDPELNAVQKQVAAHALLMMEKPMQKALVRQIEKAIARDPASIPAYTEVVPPVRAGGHGGGASTSSVDTSATDSADDTLTSAWREMSRASLKELKAEELKLKNAAFERMNSYMEKHPESIIGKLWNAPKDKGGETVREILTEYGFTPENFRGVNLRNSATGSTILAAKFFSQKLNREVGVEIELISSSTFPLSSMRIVRVYNLKDIVKLIEPEYDLRVQELVHYSRADVTEQSIHDEAIGVVRRIRQEPGAKKFFRAAKKFLEETETETETEK